MKQICGKHLVLFNHPCFAGLLVCLKDENTDTAFMFTAEIFSTSFSSSFLLASLFLFKQFHLQLRLASNSGSCCPSFGVLGLQAFCSAAIWGLGFLLCCITHPQRSQANPDTSAMSLGGKSYFLNPSLSITGKGIAMFLYSGQLRSRSCYLLLYFLHWLLPSFQHGPLMKVL